MNKDLKCAFIRAGKKQYDVAKDLDMPQSKMSEIVNEARPVTEQDKERIAKALNRPVADLFPSHSDVVIA